MTKKKVFLGSTNTDLIDIRAELTKLIPRLGFKLICFEDPKFEKSAEKHAHDVCLDNVANCDIYLLIIAERFGEKYRGANLRLRNKSVTWAEVEVALRKKKAICAFVRRVIWNEKSTYEWNKKQGIKIKPFFAKNKRVFDFIEYILAQKKNNWIDQFNDGYELKILVRKRLGHLK